MQRFNNSLLSYILRFYFSVKERLKVNKSIPNFRDVFVSRLGLSINWYYQFILAHFFFQQKLIMNTSSLSYSIFLVPCSLFICSYIQTPTPCLVTTGSSPVKLIIVEGSIPPMPPSITMSTNFSNFS